VYRRFSALERESVTGKEREQIDHHFLVVVFSVSNGDKLRVYVLSSETKIIIFIYMYINTYLLATVL
jgi:hypothetical protein